MRLLSLASPNRLTAAAFGHGPLLQKPRLFWLYAHNVRPLGNAEARKARDRESFAADQLTFFKCCLRRGMDCRIVN
jgi:hypothetical protein